jgi:SRSO17 transposase
MVTKAPFPPDSTEHRFDLFVDLLAAAIGHADRLAPLRAYCTGLFLPGERKSVEPMAASIAPANVRSQHQSMHHFVAQAPWSDRQVLDTVRDYALPIIEGHGHILAWIVDDTGHPKKGKHSVGVVRQYCGQLGKRENCQVAVSLSVANESASLPIAYDLYLPEEWAADFARRDTAGVPESVAFHTKPEIALAQIRQAVEAGVRRGVVIADAGFGHDTKFRDALRELKLQYAVGINSLTTVWPEGTGPLPPPAYAGMGRPPTRWRRDAAHQPISVKELALELAEAKFRTVAWREGSKGQLESRFCAVRVRAAHGDNRCEEPRAEEWLIIEWPEGEDEPTTYFLSTLPKTTSLTKLVYTIKLRWRIERDYQELKQEIGLGHFEGRGWRGFHHHATLSIAAYAFLVAERGRFSPSGVEGKPKLKVPRLPRGFRPRGAPDSSSKTQSGLSSNNESAVDRRAGHATIEVSVLSKSKRQGVTKSRIDHCQFITQ